MPASWVSTQDAPLVLPIGAPCTRACTGCAAPTASLESTRIIRQRLVRAAGDGVGHLAFAGPSPWEHPALPEMIREAGRLGFTSVEVWGPIHPLATLSVPAAERMAALTRVCWPRLDDVRTGVSGHVAQTEAARARLAELLPHVVLLEAEPSDAGSASAVSGVPVVPCQIAPAAGRVPQPRS